MRRRADRRRPGRLNGDGFVDLAVSRSGLSDILILANDGQGNFSVLVSLPVGSARRTT